MFTIFKQSLRTQICFFCNSVAITARMVRFRFLSCLHFITKSRNNCSYWLDHVYILNPCNNVASQILLANQEPATRLCVNIFRTTERICFIMTNPANLSCFLERHYVNSFKNNWKNRFWKFFKAVSYFKWNLKTCEIWMQNKKQIRVQATMEVCKNWVPSSELVSTFVLQHKRLWYVHDEKLQAFTNW